MNLDPISAAKLQQGDFAVYLLGRDNADVLAAQEMAAQVQALLIVKDQLLKATIPDDKQRQNALFGSIAKPDEVRASLEKEFSGQYTEEDITAARSIVNRGAGLKDTHPAVPPFSPIFGRFIDRDLVQGILHVQTGLRIANLVNDESLEYPKANANPKFDPPALLDASNQLNELIAARNTDAFPSTDEQEQPYFQTSDTVIKEGLEKIKIKYPEVAANLEKALDEAFDIYADKEPVLTPPDQEPPVVLRGPGPGQPAPDVEEEADQNTEQQADEDTLIWMANDYQTLVTLKSKIPQDEPAYEDIHTELDERAKDLHERHEAGDVAGYSLYEAVQFQDDIGWKVSQRAVDLHAAHGQEPDEDKRTAIWGEYEKAHAVSGGVWSTIASFRDPVVTHLSQTNRFDNLHWKYLDSLVEIRDTIYESFDALRAQHAAQPDEALGSYFGELSDIDRDIASKERNARLFVPRTFQDNVEEAASLHQLSAKVQDLGDKYKAEREALPSDSASHPAYEEIQKCQNAVANKVEEERIKFDEVMDPLSMRRNVDNDQKSSLRERLAKLGERLHLGERLRGVGKHLNENKGLLAASIGTGFVTKIAFMTAAASLTVPGFVAIPAAAIVANVATKVTARLYEGRKDENREKGWWRAAVKEGLRDALNPKAIGLSLLGAGTGYALGHMLHGVFGLGDAHHGAAAQHGTGTSNNSGADTSHTGGNNGSGGTGTSHTGGNNGSGGTGTSHTGGNNGSGGAVTPAPVDATDALKNDLQNFLKDNSQFAQSHEALKKAAEKALASGQPKDLLKACKEISFKMINGSGHNAATSLAGGKLVEDGVAVSDQFKLGTSVVSKMLMRDEAYLKLHGLFGQAKDIPGAQDLATRSGRIGKSFVDYITHLRH